MRVNPFRNQEDVFYFGRPNYGATRDMAAGATSGLPYSLASSSNSVSGDDGSVDVTSFSDTQDTQNDSDERGDDENLPANVSRRIQP